MGLYRGVWLCLVLYSRDNIVAQPMNMFVLELMFLY